MLIGRTSVAAAAVARRKSSIGRSSGSGGSGGGALLRLAILAAANNAAMSSAATPAASNVLGGPLECCCTAPMTGYYRDGFCRTGGGDFGVHVVCAQVTDEFLAYTRARGNDLSTPFPPSFPGLKAGDKWCLCASRWQEALEAGVAPPVVLAATHARALDFVSLSDLKAHAVDWTAVTAEAEAQGGAAPKADGNTDGECKAAS